jgi:hypothetical protein
MDDYIRRTTDDYWTVEEETARYDPIHHGYTTQRIRMMDNYDDHDDQYLFRLVSTFGWDDANAICNRLFTEVETAADACRRDDDNAVDERTTVVPDKTYDEYYDYDGNDNDILQQQRRRQQRRQRYQNRNTLQRWLNRVEAQLYYTDQWGNCALHAASYVKPPVDVITNIFR